MLIHPVCEYASALSYFQHIKNKMCSIGEDDFGDEGGLHAMIKDDTMLDINTNLGRCAKCSSDGPLIKLKFRDAECKNCFLAYVRHKFRATLGSSKILHKGAEVLLLFDGSSESLAMLDMMNYAQTQNTHKRLHVNGKILFIDEKSINDQTNIHDVKTLLSKYSFEAFVVSIADKTSLFKLDELDKYLDSVGNEKGFISTVNSIKTLTSRQEFIKIWKNNIIESVANQLKCDFVFSPEISTILASQLLNSISLGRGDSTALDVSLLDDRFQNVKILRPLRTLNRDEIDFYLEVNRLKPIKIKSYGEDFGSHSSIQNLTKRFVEDLQTNFSSTISTVFRTGDKIAPRSNTNLVEESEIKECHFCKSKLSYKPSKTLSAIEFSRLVSASGGMEEAPKQILIEDRISKSLCHACANIQKDSELIDLINNI